ncbi:hypothetical protein L1987_35935 [Smallanthus sonchifolius]|uniref:Uncharacterized protein n=1 Tax=Smallanthus sonchifolius TaxID=185202 RepID=A0ACB9HD01_9ASTR|nr:hypothetical protein L1987_35935 [Smallanthus sonchifolius]
MNPNSWEEQAFAADGLGPLGGFIWPPRSYSCSFCRREFRSAQALGGHMNVHRKQKAKLNQTAPFFPSLAEESLDSSSDTKSSCVYDEDLLVPQTNLVLGFDLDSCMNMGVGGGKRRRTDDHVPPPIMEGGLDLELRLASLGSMHAESYNTLMK